MMIGSASWGEKKRRAVIKERRRRLHHYQSLWTIPLRWVLRIEMTMACF